jgi:hypothetical protein
MVAAIEALELPIQLLATGTALGMASALARHRRTSAVDHWPVHIARWAVGLFAVGLLFSLIEALS